MPGSQPILILGASVRAAAQSARAAGFEPLAIDLFADLDTQRCSRTRQCEHYPDDLAALAASLPSAPWMYSGGLENHPEIVDRIAADRPLLGNRGSVLRMVRDPWAIAKVLNDRGFTAPACLPPGTQLPTGRWLTKRLKSAGGRYVQFAGDPLAQVPNLGTFVQAFVEGPSFSAVFLAAKGQSQLLGVTEQLVGCQWLGAQPFWYCGSLFPSQLPAEAIDEFAAIGRRLAAAFPLQGLFGVDAVFSAGSIWPVEVNPRLTASVEILERAHAFSGVKQHLDACQNGQLPAIGETIPRSASGKVIVCAKSDFKVTPQLSGWLLEQSEAKLRLAADIPQPGSLIRQGHPICTLLADAADRETVMDSLRERAEGLYRRIPGTSAKPAEGGNGGMGLSG